ncbi:hypothetical protein [Mycobacterium leprae]|uniref:non-homologous end-joining DNA ligase LigD n=1 Tax=Mycobacterium leprae TaxID=1769 RepID=UPI0039BF70B5
MGSDLRYRADYFPADQRSQRGCTSYTPLDHQVSSRGAVLFAKNISQQLENVIPTLVTSIMTRRLLMEKVFVDWSQNRGSKSTIVPY